MILHIVKTECLGGHRVHLWFNDGTDGEVDLQPSLDGPIYEPFKEVNYFQRFRLDGHTLSWENGADFAPEYLHEMILSNIST